MANASRRSALGARARVIGSITFSIFVGVAVIGWFAGWQTIEQYSFALYIAGLGAVLVGLAGLVGNQTGGTPGQFGAAGLEIAHNQTRGQSDYWQGTSQSFAFLMMMSVVAMLVAGAGFVLQVLFG
jgi:hypothetical protein